MKKWSYIATGMLVMFLILLTVRYFRYHLGIQKIPNDFAVNDKDDNWFTYVRQGKNHFKQAGNYIEETPKQLITKCEYIEAYKRLLMSDDFWGPQVTNIESTYQYEEV